MRTLLSNLVLFLLVSFPLYGREKVVITGSTTLYPIISELSEKYMDNNPEVSITCASTGSGVGILSVINGTADIGNASRKIKAKEIKLADEAGKKLEEIVIAADGIVLVTHKENKIKNLTLEQVCEIYSGSIANWKEIDGQDKPIVIFSRDASSGTFDVFKKKVLKKNKLSDKAIYLASNKSVRDAVRETEYSIGYISYGYVNETVRSIKIDGVDPSIKNIHSSEYPLSRKLYIYTNNPSEICRKFIDYVLSEEGQAFIKKLGMIPVLWD